MAEDTGILMALIPSELKKRLEEYCADSEEKQVEVIIEALDSFLSRQQFDKEQYVN